LIEQKVIYLKYPVAFNACHLHEIITWNMLSQWLVFRIQELSL